MTDATTNTGAPKRPTFLTVLCILSFIAAGIMIVIYGLGMTGAAMVESGAVSEMVSETGDAEAMARVEEAQADLSEAGEAAGGSVTSLLGLKLGLTILSLIGVIMMWKLRKTGFFVYTGAELLVILSPIFMGGEMGFGFMTFVSVLFIVLYGMNLKHMR